MTQIIKVTLGVSTLGAIGGGVAFASGVFNNPKSETKFTTKNQLEKEGFKVLTNTDNTKWEKVLNAYRLATTKTFTGQADKSRTLEDLKSECKKQLELNTEKSYTLTRQWCVEETKISVILGKNYTILNPDDNAETNKDVWGQKVELLKKAPEKFQNLKDKIKDPEPSAGKHIEIIKKECKALKEKDTVTTNEAFGDEFEQVREYCSIKKDSSN